LKIIGLKSEDVMGKLVTTLVLTNDLMKSLTGSVERKTEIVSMKIFADGKESYFEKRNHKHYINQQEKIKLLTLGMLLS
jgi:hypothetical protein